MRYLLIACALCALGLSNFFIGTVHAGEVIIYQWADDSGVVHFGNMAPKDREYTVLKRRVDTPAVAAPKPALDEEHKRLAAERAVYCEQARQNIKVLSTFKNVKGTDGKALTDNDMKQQMLLAKQQETMFCSDGKVSI